MEEEGIGGFLGSYQITSFSIKAAKSRSEISHIGESPFCFYFKTFLQAKKLGLVGFQEMTLAHL